MSNLKSKNALVHVSKGLVTFVTLLALFTSLKTTDASAKVKKVTQKKQDPTAPPPTAASNNYLNVWLYSPEDTTCSGSAGAAITFNAHGCWTFDHHSVSSSSCSRRRGLLQDSEPESDIHLMDQTTTSGSFALGFAQLPFNTPNVPSNVPQNVAFFQTFYSDDLCATYKATTQGLVMGLDPIAQLDTCTLLQTASCAAGDTTCVPRFSYAKFSLSAAPTTPAYNSHYLAKR